MIKMVSKATALNYYKLTKPGIIYGNMLTAIAGYLFASHWHDGPRLIGLVIGLALVIGCGCVINNVIDKDIDSQMERTKKRSLVTGNISKDKAIKFATVLGIAGMIDLAVFTNFLTVLVGLFGLVVYVIFYGLAKRKTHHSTLIGALAGAVPPLAGYTAFTGFIDLGGLLLFLTLICWQMTHFYAIGLYRQKEYAKAKLPIWPIIKGQESTRTQATYYIVLFTIFAASLSLTGYSGFTFLIFVIFLGFGWLWYAVTASKNYVPPEWGKHIFKSSLFVILALSVALALGPILP